MTSSEVKTAGSLYHLSAKKMGTEPVTRKASFKCPVPNKAASQRITRKVVLPMSTVQALTFKFNELSQMNQSQKSKITQHAVKNMLNVNGKQSTIKVVICRKPSASKHKKPEDLVVRKRVSIKKFQSESDTGKEIANIHKNVLQKISEYEEMKKSEENSIPIKKRIAKMQVPKILVDIDLGSENCKTNHSESNANIASKQIICDEKLVSVKSAINLFENNSNSSVVNKKVMNDHNQTLDGNSAKELSDKENNLEVKAKPIAAIKPILKKSEDKTVKKTKLSPKDSLNRKKYISMKRELAKEMENSGKDSKEETNPVKDTEKRLENNSSLHKHILQSNQNLVAKEIPLNDIKPSEDSVISNQVLKPNTSFLWSRKEDTNVEKRPINRMNLPLPVPPENFIPNIIEKEDTIYDDVRPMSQESEDEGFEKLTDSDDDTYDDVGIYWRNNESDGKQSNKNDLQTEVRKKNMLNELSSTKILEEKYFYDDGEGERYQYISDKSETLQSNKSNDLEIYQYIQNTNDDFNIYEDIQSIKSQLTSKDKTKDIYEDINCVEDSVTDNHSINNCYESVYNGIYSRNNETQPYIKSDVSDTSNTSGRSTYEKSNSLYGMSAGNVADNENGIILGNSNDCLNSGVYHATLYEPPRPNSETSQSNSDEWIEVSESEPEETVYLVHERPKKQRSGGGTWTQKERRRWKRLQQKAHLYEEESKSQNSDDHLYESVGNYESTGVIREENIQALPADQSHHLNQNQIINDDQYIDDFDSQSSGDEAYVNTKLPDVPPNHGYNITKSLKAAGKKIRKNFSLRKSDISKSLKRFKKSSRPKIDETVFVANKEPETDLLPKPESPSTPTNLNNSIYSNNSDSSYGSHNFTKSNSSGDIKSQRHRKSWTFRSKFKSSSSLDASENSQIIDANRNSTFYLSLNEVEPRKLEKRDELLNEMQSVLSQRGGNSLDNASEKVDKDSNNRHSDNLSATTKPRPNVPPPPPPALSKIEIATEKTKYSDILWGEKSSNNSLYVESGLFDKQKKHSRCTDSDTSLYAEIGLYAASDVLTHKKTQMFVDEPLYQFYTECVNQRARDDILNNYDSEGYEEINDFYSVINEKRRTIDIKNVRPNFEDFNDDVRPEVTSFRSILDKRTLWCQIPAVIDSCILETLSEQARKLQEAKFEILTSEGSYMNSLNVLESHFMKKVGDLNMITKRDFRILFSNIVAVKKCSENFLEDLENCWKNNIMLNGICDIVYKHATTSFQVYTKYCKNQICIYRTLRELVDKNANFESALKEIENDPICQNLNIHSFLMLPMQRITRLPLLMGAVLARLDKSDDEYEICKASFDVLNKIVQDCDDEARRMEKCEEMLILSQQIEFPKDIRRIPIITGSRFLVKSGQVTQLVNRDENKLTFGKKFSKVSLTLFLFTDLLIVAKRKNVRNYVVVDHCPRNLVQMQTTDGLSQLPVKLNTNSESGSKLLMLLSMLENHEKKTVEMILSFEMESDRQRWLDAVTPKLSENPDECIYEEWDCPQVISLYEFTPSQPDELNLCIGDVVNVLKKMNDGWYQGERLRDGARGWFPQNHTQEISSSHVRAKNKKLRYQLLALSGNLIDSQKMNGK